MLPNPLRRIRALHRVAPEDRSLGQSLVEFALTLPVILMLTLIALDFGRVYLGYINVQNMARIAANFAANNPDAWGSSPDATVQVQYRNQILADATATNCQLPETSGVAVVPGPTFADTNGDGITTNLGDEAKVAITCTFTVITPVISNVVGGSVSVTAESNFPIKAGMTAFSATGGGSGSGTAPNAAFIANSEVVSPAALSVIGPDVSVDFRDTSGGSPGDSFLWTFRPVSPSGSDATSVLQDVVHPFSCATPPCTYTVTLEVTNAWGSDSASMDVTVSDASEVNFTSDTQAIDRTQSVSFTDESTSGGTSHAWTFGDGGTSTATNPSHTYNTTGTFTVSLTVTYPAPTGAVTTTKTGYITVNPGYCPVPSLVGVKVNSANAIWQGPPNNFTGAVLPDTGAPNGNFTITQQSITGGPGQTALCDSDIYVGAP